MHAFETWFREHFGASAPVGHCLRTDLPARWLRLHSLPESKRYAEDDDERAEVRRRARAAAAAVLPAGAPVWLSVPNYTPELDALQAFCFEEGGRYAHERLDEPVHVHAAQITWPHEGFDGLIEEVACDALRAVWFSVASGEVFAPYDGGIDLLAASPERALALRRVFPPEWFSTRTSGL